MTASTKDHAAIGAPMNDETSEAAIRDLLARFVAAVCAKDLEAMLACTGPAIATFDVGAPLQNKGPFAVRKLWKDTVEAYETIEYAMYKLDVFTGGDVGFSRSMNTFGGKQAGAHSVVTLQSTLGFQRIAGEWKIVHEHASMPFDAAMKALTSLPV